LGERLSHIKKIEFERSEQQPSSPTIEGSRPKEGAKGRPRVRQTFAGHPFSCPPRGYDRNGAWSATNQPKIGCSAENAATGTNNSKTGQAAANALTYSKHNRKLPCGQPIETARDQEFDCHDDNGKGAKNH
jgi:hypothetical protein